MGRMVPLSLLVLIVSMVPMEGFACMTFNDDFEGYANETELDVDWPNLWVLTGVQLVTGDPTAHSGTQYLFLPTTDSRREWGHCIEAVPTDATPYVMEFWMRCRGTVQGNNYCEALRWEGDPPTYVSMVIQFGDYDGRASVGYTGRIWILDGNGPGSNFDTGWFEVGGSQAPRRPHTWQHLRIIMTTRTHQFFVEETLFHTVVLPVDTPMITHFYVGADGIGPSSHDVDDLRFEPLPPLSGVENWSGYR